MATAGTLEHEEPIHHKLSRGPTTPEAGGGSSGAVCNGLATPVPKVNPPTQAAASPTGYTLRLHPTCRRLWGTRPDLPCCRLRMDPAATSGGQLLDSGQCLSDMQASLPATSEIPEGLNVYFKLECFSKIQNLKHQ